MAVPEAWKGRLIRIFVGETSWNFSLTPPTISASPFFLTNGAISRPPLKMPISISSVVTASLFENSNLLMKLFGLLISLTVRVKLAQVRAVIGMVSFLSEKLNLFHEFIRE